MEIDIISNSVAKPLLAVVPGKRSHDGAPVTAMAQEKEWRYGKSFLGALWRGVLLLMAALQVTLVEADVVVSEEGSSSSRSENGATIYNFEATVMEGDRGGGTGNRGTPILGEGVTINVMLTGEDVNIIPVLPRDANGQQVLDLDQVSMGDGRLSLTLYLANGVLFDYEALTDTTMVHTLELSGRSQFATETGNIARIDITLTVINVDEGTPETRPDQLLFVPEDAFVGTDRAIAGSVQTRNDTTAVVGPVAGLPDEVTDFRIGQIIPLNADGSEAEPIGSNDDPDLGAADKPFAITPAGRIQVKAVAGDNTPLNHAENPSYRVFVQARDDIPEDQWGAFGAVIVQVQAVRPPPQIPAVTLVVNERVPSGTRVGQRLQSEDASLYRVNLVTPEGRDPIFGSDPEAPFIIDNTGQVSFRSTTEFPSLNHEEVSRFVLQLQAGRSSPAGTVWGPSAPIDVMVGDIDETPRIDDQEFPVIGQITGEPGGTFFGDPVVVENRGDSENATGARALRYTIDQDIEGHTENAEITFGMEGSTGRLQVREGQVTEVRTYRIGVRVADPDVADGEDVVDYDTALVSLRVTPDGPPAFVGDRALIPLPDVIPDDEGEIGPRIVAADPEGEELTYAITRIISPSGVEVATLPFEIDRATGQLTIETTDRELDPGATYEFIVTSTDANGTQSKSTDIEVIIARTVVDNPPRILTVRPLMVAENSVGNLGEPLVYRDDYGDSVVKWEIIGVKAGSESGREVTPSPFAIDERDGQLRIASGQQLDYEILPPGQRYYTLSVTVSTQAATPGAEVLVSAPATVRIFVTDVDDPPVFAQTDYNLVVSGSEEGDPVGLVSAVDPLGRAVTHRIVTVVDPGAGVTLDTLPFVLSTAGELRVSLQGGRRFFDTVDNYEFTVSATSAGGRSTVRVDVNANPDKPDIVGPERLLFPELGRAAAEPLVVRLDRGNLADLAWALVPEDARFIIDPEGQEPGRALLRLREGLIPFDLETVDFDPAVEGRQTSTTVTVEACNTTISQGGCDTEVITVTVVDVDEAPIFPGAPYQRQVPENAPDGFAVGDPVSARDEENEPLIYSLSPDSAPFIINASNGQIWVDLEEGEKLDFEIEPEYELVVTAIEAEGEAGSRLNSTSTRVAVTLVNLDDEKPVIVAGQVLSVAAGVPDETQVGRVLVEDPDGADVSGFTYSATPAPSAATPFKIDPGTGLVTVELGEGILPQDPVAHTLLVTARDRSGNVSEPAEVRIEVLGDSSAAERRGEIGVLTLATASASAGLLIDALRPQLALSDTELATADNSEQFAHLVTQLFGGESDRAGEARATGHRRFANLDARFGLGPGRTPVPVTDLSDEDGMPGDDAANRYSLWIRSGQRTVDSEVSLGHGSMNYDGNSWAMTAGLERRLGTRALVGVAISHVESALDYEIDPNRGVRTSGNYEEVAQVLSLYGVYRPQARIRFWAMAGGGAGEIKDSRVTIVSREQADAPSTQVLGAFGVDYGFAFGSDIYQLELNLKASGYGVRKETEELRYRGGEQETVVSGTSENLFEFRSGVRVGLPFALPGGGRIKPYAGLDWLYNPGNYHLSDDIAFDAMAGFEWQWQRLHVTFEGNYEVDRDNQELWGVRGEIRYALLPDGSGLSLALTGDYDVAGSGQSAMDTAVPGAVNDAGSRPFIPAVGHARLSLRGSYGFADWKRNALWVLYTQFKPRLSAVHTDSHTVGLRFVPMLHRWRAELQFHGARNAHHGGARVFLNFTGSL